MRPCADSPAATGSKPPPDGIDQELLKAAIMAHGDDARHCGEFCAATIASYYDRLKWIESQKV